MQSENLILSEVLIKKNNIEVDNLKKKIIIFSLSRGLGRLFQFFKKYIGAKYFYW